jgi:hypothetical protein
VPRRFVTRSDPAGMDLSEQEISFAPGILENRKPLIVTLSDERLAILKEKFQDNGPRSTPRISVGSRLRRAFKLDLEQTGR